MKRPFYLFNAGRMSRKDNTLCFVAVNEAGEEQPAKHLPIETVNELFAFGALDANSAIYNFLGQHHVPVHFFDYYGHYTGSFMARDYLQSGRVHIAQTKAYLDPKKRVAIAQSFVDGASFNMLKNLKYYDNRGRDMEPFITRIETYRESIPLSKDVPQLMGLEGNCRSTYYDAFDLIINDFEMGNRTKQPPSNEVNALISFGNMLCYTLALSQIYHTQLNPTISFLHEPGERRFSLSLDIAEIFKPIYVDRIIFKLLNKKEIQAKHFDRNTNGCRLNETGKQIFTREWDTKLKETIKHRVMNKQVSYRHLVKLECYKLMRHFLDEGSVYKPLKMYW